ncbi:MAG: FKBP-type peptidyl-prolyl cis-trans isomerase [Methanobacteriota archaeon]
MPKAKTQEDSDAPAIVKGDIVRIDYTGWSVETDGDKMFDTTVKSDAEKEEIFDEKTPYKPIPLIAGDGRVFKGLDNAIIGSKVGEEKEVVILPADGAGERDPKNYTVRPLREFLRQEIEPHIGKRVVVGDKSGYVVAVSSGRVRVDFNDRLAGRKLKYKFTVKEKLGGIEEKVLAIIEMSYGATEGFKVEPKGEDGVDIVLADICKYDEKWFVSKYKAVSDLRETLGLNKIRFVEEYVKKAEPKKEKTDAAAEEKKEAPSEPAPEEISDAKKTESPGPKESVDSHHGHKHPHD